MSSSQKLPDQLKCLVLEFLKTESPKNLSELASHLEQSPELLEPILQQLLEENILIMVPSDSQSEGSPETALYRLNPDQDIELETAQSSAQDGSNVSTQESSKSPEPSGAGKFKFPKFSTIIWAIVVVVVLIPLIGQLFIAQAFAPDSDSSARSSQPSLAQSSDKNTQSSSQIDWLAYENQICDKLEEARAEAEEYAQSELDKWGDTLIEAVDNSFLDWYFGYFNQKSVEYKAFLTGISANTQRWLDPNSQTPEEKIAEQITEDFQVEFSKRVLRPIISQLTLKRIATKTSKKYLQSLRQDFSEIPRYAGIPKAQWQEYLENTSVNIPDIEGNIISFPLARVSTATAYLAFKPVVKSAIPAVGTKVVTKLSAKVGAKVAGKTAGAVAGKVGGTLLDASVGVGIVLWDIWDTNRSATVEKPIVRQNLVSYINELESSILDNPDSGIMTIIDRIDRSLFEALTAIKNLEYSGY